MTKSLLLVLVGSLLLCLSLSAQTTITGKIQDSSGTPIEGAVIQIKGTSIGTFSNKNGSYLITSPGGTSAILVSLAGYEPIEVSMEGRNEIDVELNEASILGQVIITGYGDQLKREVSGSIAKIEGEDFRNTPVPSIEQAIQGRAAGMFIESVNGKQGAAVRMRIRGTASLTATNQPLFVIDGIPITTEAQNISGSALNPLAGFNFDDVASVEILKDASASAIYGSRAANGVVLITTREGHKGKTKVQVNLQGGITQAARKKDFLNSGDYINFFRQTAVGAANYDWNNQLDAFNLEGNYTQETNEETYIGFIESRFDRYSGHSDWAANQTRTDWQDLAFQDAQFQQANFSISGGDEKTSFYLSGNYGIQQGILIGNDLKKAGTRINIIHQANDKLQVGLKMSLSQTQTDQVAGDNEFPSPLQMTALSPITPTRDLAGKLYNRPVTTYYNGLIETEDASRDVVTSRNLTNGFATYELIPGLEVRGEVGLDLLTLKDNAFFGKETDAGQSTNGLAYSYWSQVTNLNSKAYLTFEPQFSTSHALKVVAGIEYQESTRDVTQTEGQGFPVDDLKTVANAGNISIGSAEKDAFRFLSYFGRVNYKLSDKYLLTISARMDGSSRFGKNNRFGFFPAASVGWILSEEEFLAENEAISFLKLRGSYGLTGNADILNYRHLGLFSGDTYGGSSGLQPTQMPNPDLKWETTTQWDIGLDFGFWNDRITGGIDYYHKRSTDLLLDVPVPGTSGFSNQTQNLAEVENKGFELLITSHNLTENFSWITALNISSNQNKILSLGGQAIIDEGGEEYMNALKVGEAIGAFYGVEYAGVDPSNGDALFYTNGEGSGTTNDYSEASFIVLGDPNPDFIFGFENEFSFKDISLSIFLQGVQGNEIHNAAGSFMSCGGCWFDNQTKDQLNAWQQPGDETNIPEARFFWENGNQSRSSRYLSDGSYLRVKQISLSYDLPESFSERLKMESIRIYTLAQNLWTFTNYEGWDPEVTADHLAYSTANRPNNVFAGVDFYSAPQPRTITLGLQLNF